MLLTSRFPLEVIRFSIFKGLFLFGFLGAILTSVYFVIAFLIRDALELS